MMLEVFAKIDGSDKFAINHFKLLILIMAILNAKVRWRSVSIHTQTELLTWTVNFLLNDYAIMVECLIDG